MKFTVCIIFLFLSFPVYSEDVTVSREDVVQLLKSDVIRLPESVIQLLENLAQSPEDMVQLQRDVLCKIWVYQYDVGLCIRQQSRCLEFEKLNEEGAKQCKSDFLDVLVKI